jgi:acetyl esterase/lipase
MCLEFLAHGATPAFQNLSYLEPESEQDAYRRDRTVLDIYTPPGATNLPVVVWFHGGGLKDGDKTWLPETLGRQNVILVSPNYRLLPRATAVEVLEDAAAAVAWTFRNIGNYGGDPKKIYLSGHSAGAYLSTLITLDRKWLATHRLDAGEIRGLVALSAQMVAHSSFGAEISNSAQDSYSPLAQARADAPPILLLVGDREKDLPRRYDENKRMLKRLQTLGHPDVSLTEFPGTDHVSMQPSAIELLAQFISRQSSTQSPGH